MGKKVKVDDLANEILKTLDDFSGATDEAVSVAVTTTAKTLLGKLKNAHPSGSGDYGSWDKYNASWKVTQTKTDKRYHKQATIHNVKYYRLTHLLERGHALVGGGRTRAFPHIKPVADEAEELLVTNIKKEV